MDEETKDLVRASSRGAAQGVTQAFLDTLLGPLVEAAASVRDRVRFGRWKSEVRMLEEAREFLRAQDIEPKRVPAKVLFPLLNFALLEDEDDEDMLHRWAALLANAAAGTDRGATVLPSFPHILSELSPEEAAILDLLYDDPDPARVPSLYQMYLGESSLPDQDPLFYTRCFNLERLGLLLASWENVQIASDPAAYRHVVARLEGNALGLSFVLACTPPV